MESLENTHLNSLTGKYASSRPRRLLSLDGGGIFGIISLEILKKIETDLAHTTGMGDDFRLGDFFDYIGGTSTGAIIAAALAIGKTVDEVIDFYVASGQEMFTKSRIFDRFRARHTSRPLEEKLKNELEGRTLGASDLRCLLLIVCQNATTNSPWFFSNNPFQKYNQRTHPNCNLDVPLWQLVRASTAAPTFFLPEPIALKNLQNSGQGTSKPNFFFVDGGVTPYNNPAYKLYQMATLPEYKTMWKTGENKLMLLSVGTGTSLTGDPKIGRNGRPLPRIAKRTPAEMMSAMSLEQDINCRAAGRCAFGPHIDNELTDMVPKDDSVTNRRFLYARYDPKVGEIDLESLETSIPVEAKHFEKMNNPKYIPEMRAVGEAYAKKYVDLSPFDAFT